MTSQEINLHEQLKKYFGFSQFKGLQEEVIRSIVNGHNTFDQGWNCDCGFSLDRPDEEPG